MSQWPKKNSPRRAPKNIFVCVSMCVFGCAHILFANFLWRKNTKRTETIVETSKSYFSFDVLSVFPTFFGAPCNYRLLGQNQIPRSIGLDRGKGKCFLGHTDPDFLRDIQFWMSFEVRVFEKFLKNKRLQKDAHIFLGHTLPKTNTRKR